MICYGLAFLLGIPAAVYFHNKRGMPWGKAIFSGMGVIFILGFIVACITNVLMKN